MVALGVSDESSTTQQWPKASGLSGGLGAVGSGRKQALGRSRSLGIQQAGTGRLNLASIWEHPTEEEVKAKELKFGEMVTLVSQWFAQWSECERAVMLYSLVKQLPPSQCFFLQSLLDHASCCSPHASSSAQPPEPLARQQLQANNPEFITSLKNNETEVTVKELLAHLPLLKPENSAAKTAYLSVIDQVLCFSTNQVKHLEGSKQLLSFALIHPAVSATERLQLSKWLPILENCTNAEQQQHQAADVTQEAARTDGLHPAVNISHSLQPGMMYPSSQTLPMHKPNYLRSQRHPPLAPTASAPPGFGSNRGSRFSGAQRAVTDWLQSGEKTESGNNSGSDTDQKPQQVVIQPCGKGPGMGDMMFIWLRTLRLHKYAKIFQDMTYDEMIRVDKDFLEKHEVTKGAQKKWAQSIQKLNERSETLHKIQLELDPNVKVSSERIKNAIVEIHNVLGTPIKPYKSNANPSTASEVDTEGTEESSSSCNKKVEASDVKLKSSDGGTSLEDDAKDVTTTDANADASESKKESCDEEEVCVPVEIVDVDIPGEITATMGRVSTQLLQAFTADEMNNCCFLKLVEQCKEHESFTEEQKKQLECWKNSLQKLWGIHAPKHKFADRELQQRFGSAGPTKSVVTRSVSGPHRRLNGHKPLARKSSLTPFYTHLATDFGGKQSLTRTRSAPMPQQLRPVTKQRETIEMPLAGDQSKS